MAAESKPSVRVTKDAWTQVSAADIHTLQCVRGRVGVVYAPSQPGPEVQVGQTGFLLEELGFLTNSAGGTAWARAKVVVGSAIVAVTEG